MDIEDFINADSLKTAIDQNQAKIASFFVADTRRFAAIIDIQINANGRIYNVLEYSIALKKPEFVRIFISVRIPSHERELYRAYKQFLNHYNSAYSGSSYDQTPIQRMLTMVRRRPYSVQEIFLTHVSDFSSLTWSHWFLSYSNNSSMTMVLI